MQPVTYPLQSSKRWVLVFSILGLAGFLAWQMRAMRAYIQNETRTPAWDQSVQLEIAQDYRDAIKEGRWSDAWNLAPKPGMPPFPPLFHLGIIVAQDMAGAVKTPADPTAMESAALWLNGFYLTLLCLALFGIAWEFRGDETALAAVIIFAGTPVVQMLARTQLIDLSVTAWSTVAYWAFLRSRAFHLWPGSLAFALAFAAGMLHKWSFFSYMIPVFASALISLADPNRRWKVLAASVLAAALSAPWYLWRLPILCSRLFEASADFAIPVWKGGAFFHYFFSSAQDLGPFLWLLGWMGLLVPYVLRRRDLSSVLQAWVLTSYVFWAIVPNRQMRFLIPGLPALAVLALGSWPKTLIWALTAFQAFSAANYAAGWIGPFHIPMPQGSLACLTSDPPVKGDWKIADILREAQRRHPRELPLSNLTLVSNTERFNGPNFNWTLKALKLPNIRIRGVNRRLCEFSRFVVLKHGSLGPSGATQGLPEAAAIIEKKDGWFQKAYAQAERWPLPDGSEAILYEQRKPCPPPLPRTPLRFEHYSAPPFSAEQLLIETGDWDPNACVYSQLSVQAAQAQLRGLKLFGLSIDMESARLIPAGERPQAPMEDVRFLRINDLRVRAAALEAQDLKAFLESRAPQLKVRDVVFERDIRIAAAYKRIPLFLRGDLALETRPPGLKISATEARIGRLRVPQVLLRRFGSWRLPFEPNPEMPFAIHVPGLTLKNNRLSIP